ncbi:ABC1 kinase family protein [Desulfitobacterium metallireducens]|uniref:ABC transporter n=1 Tax=Desulfitobacterium metallireducens DSM 15288 TaxID=871968 RepID=W0ED47_9FIRM|nr:AarF/UbiB family protein [Desulfitobacterium metallireducens]AHF07119.1 ABC transporter [Desulfitobacterium metallireducens DSM 15288]
MIGKRIRHLNRYREVATVLARHGFGLIIEEMGLTNLLSLPKRLIFQTQEEIDPQTVGARLRHALEELGPTYVKLGQIASTRPDILPDFLIRELEKLQDQVAPFPYDEASQIIESELGKKPTEIFERFEEIPIAAASIGQVYRAVLKSGEKVAVKVQRPQITQTIETDLEILLDLATIAENRVDWAKHYQLKEMVEEFARSLRSELDYSIEGRNAEKIGSQFKDTPEVHIPKIYWDYSTKKILTLEFVHGVKLSQFEDLTALGYSLKTIGENLVKAMFKQILIDGFFHGDPHPGNIFILPGQIISLIDFGMVGRLSSEMKYNFSSLVIGMMRKKTKDMVDAVLDMGIAPSDVNMKLLYRDVDNLREKYLDVAMSEIHLGEAVNDLFKVAYRHRIQIPADLVLLGKSLLSLEGIVEQLDPEISIIDIAQPYGKQLLKERFEPKNIAEKTWNNLRDTVDLAVDLPQQAKEFLRSAQNGKIRFEIVTPELGNFLKKMDRLSNQLSFSLVLLAFSIIMAGLIIASALGGSQPILFGRIPAIDVGFTFAFIMFVLLIASIFRSGRF